MTTFHDDMTTFHFATLLLWLGIQNAGMTVEGAILYTHWGRQTCGNLQTELIYTGYMGGGNFGTTPGSDGSGSNYLCLPRTPTFANYDSDFYVRARIKGVEYENGGSGGNFPFDVPEETPLQDQNMLCSVCAVQNASLVMMVPGRADCYPGWTMEYWGYLVAHNHNNPSKTEYICLDKSPEGEPGGGGDENAARIYSVEGQCGALPCPPYSDGWELACVVCTK